MTYTNHCSIRKSQRGIRVRDISLLIENGSVKRAPGGVEKMVLTRKDIQGAISQKKRDIQVLSRLSGLTAVVDNDIILTVYKAR
jgi:hypothetical protein